MTRLLGVPLILITAAVIFVVVNALDAEPKGKGRQRNAFLVHDLVDAMVSEQTERQEIMEKFHKLKNQFADVKRELKQRNTLLHDAKFLLRKFKKGVKNTKKELKEELLEDLTKAMKKFRKALKSIKLFTSKIRGEINRAKVTWKQEIADTKQRITKVRTYSRKGLRTLRRQFFNFKKKIDQQYTTIAFSAQLSKSIGSTSSRMVFSKVITNIGGGYNRHDGHFYCPKDGVYMFSINLVITSHYIADAYIMKNSGTLTYAYNRLYSTGYPDVSLSIVVKLRKGDKIWVKGNGRSYYVYSYFSGVRIGS